MKVNREPKEITFNNQPFRIERGQTVTSRRVLSEETGIEESKIHRILKYFEDEQQLKQRGLFSGRLITILNYDDYQNVRNRREKSEQPNEQPSEQPIDSAKPLNSIHSGGDEKKVNSDLNSEVNTNNNIYNNIYTFWNDKKIIVHKYPPPKSGQTSFESKIKSLLKSGESEQSIKTAIENYSKIYHGDDYYFSYAWNLTDFLVRGFYKFNNWDVCSKNFRNKNNGPVTGQDQKTNLDGMSQNELLHKLN